MKLLNKLAYGLGHFTTKVPKLSTKPFKSIYSHFKEGRVDGKARKQSNMNS
jgi:hypothetical protein